MKVINIGLIAEGKTDYAVLRPFIIETLKQKGYKEKDITFKPIQPALDATSKEYTDAGWDRIRQWALRNPPSDREQMYFAPLFEDSEPLDLLIVQMDGDVLEEYANHVTTAVLPDKPWTPTQAGDFVRSTLNEWFWGGDDPILEAKHLYAISVQAIETWLIAGLDPSIAKPEEVDPVIELINLASGVRKVKNGKVTLKKKEPRWLRMATEVVPHLDHIRNVCPHCGDFLTDLEQKAEF